jgi:hypothetical protein
VSRKLKKGVLLCTVVIVVLAINERSQRKSVDVQSALLDYYRLYRGCVGLDLCNWVAFFSSGSCLSVCLKATMIREVAK